MTNEPQSRGDTIDRLYATILDRRDHPREGSYTAQLFRQGNDEMAKKVGEEAVEVVLAAASQGRERLVSESADLVYHLLVLLAAYDLAPADLYAELQKRMKP
ncbi:MAG: phosphoribosyl-ATP diphosphatase [Chloroflexota bacterium]|nr:phosphoribosyl-ATP diphosphatase [Chloroflexota bacterium]